MSTFFTADTHFGHANIIKHTDRPFADVDAMDAALMGAWNAVVSPNDEVWHLGDFGLRYPPSVTLSSSLPSPPPPRAPVSSETSETYRRN